MPPFPQKVNSIHQIWDIIFPLIQAKQTLQTPLLIAIDGRCASGKTTLASLISQELSCPVFHMDDFYLPLKDRTPERMAQVAGHMDFEMFQRDVLTPISQGQKAVYTPFCCQKQAYGQAVTIPPSRVYVVEGSYACHPSLAHAYHLKIFLTTPKDVQISRIQARNGDSGLAMFLAKWIPMEEAYFEAYDIERTCHIVIET